MYATIYFLVFLSTLSESFPLRRHNANRAVTTESDDLDYVVIDEPSSHATDENNDDDTEVPDAVKRDVEFIDADDQSDDRDRVADYYVGPAMESISTKSPSASDETSYSKNLPQSPVPNKEKKDLRRKAKSIWKLGLRRRNNKKSSRNKMSAFREADEDNAIPLLQVSPDFSSRSINTPYVLVAKEVPRNKDNWKFVPRDSNLKKIRIIDVVPTTPNSVIMAGGQKVEGATSTEAADQNNASGEKSTSVAVVDSDGTNLEDLQNSELNSVAQEDRKRDAAESSSNEQEQEQDDERQDRADVTTDNSHYVNESLALKLTNLINETKAKQGEPIVASRNINVMPGAGKYYPSGRSSNMIAVPSGADVSQPESDRTNTLMIQIPASNGIDIGKRNQPVDILLDMKINVLNPEDTKRPALYGKRNLAKPDEAFLVNGGDTWYKQFGSQNGVRLNVRVQVPKGNKPNVTEVPAVEEATTEDNSAEAINTEANESSTQDIKKILEEASDLERDIEKIAGKQSRSLRSLISRRIPA